MRVNFAAEVLSDPDSWRILDHLVDYFVEQRHLWDIEDPQAIENSPWIQSDLTGRAGKANLEILQKYYTNTIYPLPTQMHSLRIQVTLTSHSPDKLTPKEAKCCLGAPTYVVVENADSDGAFLEAMIYAWQREDSRRKKLLDAQTDGWWKIESRGGTGEITKCIAQIRAETVGPLRVFVLCDSDRLYPGYLKKAIWTIENYCQHQKVHYAILQKREIENYLPLNLLQQVPRKYKKVYQAFLKLTQEQKDFYDMKFGFKKQGNFTIIPPEQQKLFAKLPPRILADLRGGFGEKIGQYFQTKREHITAAAIKEICASNPQEIDNILDQIESLL